MTVLTPAMQLQRELWISELGFTEQQAAVLADARDADGFLVEVHTLRAALERGCDINTAFDIYS